MIPNGCHYGPVLKVADARDAQKRAEDLATKAVQRAEKFSDELAAQRAQLSEVSSQLVRAVAAHTAAVDHANGMRSERELLKEKLAIATGQLQAMSTQVEALSRQLSGGRKAAPTSSRSTPSATNGTKNIKA